MIKLPVLTTAATALAAVVLMASAAQAQTVRRAWVSGHGADAAGCGAPAMPCRSLQYVHDHIVVAGGEIDVLDPAGYGTIAITKAVSIINDGVGAAGVQAASGDAISINAGLGQAVILRGLDVEGTGAANGVHLIAGGPLTVQDSTINGFTSVGILYAPTGASSLFVSNTRVTNSGTAGVWLNPAITSGSANVHAVLTRVEVVGAQEGVISESSDSGQAVKVDMTFADSVVADTSVALEAYSSTSDPAVIMVRNSTIAGNAVGLLSSGARLDISRSTLASNGTAYSIADGGVIGSYGDNELDGNGDVGASVTILPLN
jgi:hypothetical protein